MGRQLPQGDAHRARRSSAAFSRNVAYCRCSLSSCGRPFTCAAKSACTQGVNTCQALEQSTLWQTNVQMKTQKELESRFGGMTAPVSRKLYKNCIKSRAYLQRGTGAVPLLHAPLQQLQLGPRQQLCPFGVTSRETHRRALPRRRLQGIDAAGERGHGFRVARGCPEELAFELEGGAAAGLLGLEGRGPGAVGVLQTRCMLTTVRRGGCLEALVGKLHASGDTRPKCSGCTASKGEMRMNLQHEQSIDRRTLTLSAADAQH